MGAYGIPGDPAGMRALAAYLRGHADFIGSAGAALAGPVRHLEFEGPAAEAFRSRMGMWEFGIDGEVAQLDGLAARLVRAATEVEAAQAEAARLERLRQEEEAARARARVGGPH